jgi:hypothetical protein
MRKGRRIAVLAATVAAAFSIASVAVPAPASAAHRPTGPQPVSVLLAAVSPHYGQWVSVQWRTDRRVCDVKVQVEGTRKVMIDYPSGRDYTSFSRGDTLRPGRTDYTSFRVTAHYDRPARAMLDATISYDYCGWDAPTLSMTTEFLLPVSG